MTCLRDEVIASQTRKDGLSNTGKTMTEATLTHYSTKCASHPGPIMIR